MKYKTSKKQREYSLNYYYKSRKAKLKYNKEYKKKNHKLLSEKRRAYYKKNLARELVWRKKTLVRFKKKHGLSYDWFYEKERGKKDKKYKKKQIARRAGMRKRKNIKTIESAFNYKERWNSHDKNFVIKNTGKLTHFQMSEKLGRSLFGIKRMVRKLKIKN